MSSFFLVIIFFNLPFFSFQISLLSKSRIEKCPSNSSCHNKILLSLTVQNAELKSSDSISTTLTEISQDDNLSVKRLENPIKISISKSQVKVIYPCIYFQDFNYYPKEKIIMTDYLSCKDNNNIEDTTCDISKNENNEKIPYSEGFCCSCPPLSLLFSNYNKRFGDCKKLNFGNGSSAAHCLVFDKLWYSAYKILQYKIDYEITINIEDTISNQVLYTLILSPNNNNVISEDGKISVKIIGDFLPTNSLPEDLSSYYLIVPSKPINHIKVVEGKINWMILEREKFSIDGRECDKIGVGYYAFNTQGQRCEVQKGSCLNNQIYHFENEDYNNIINGKKPKYLLFYHLEKNYSFYSDGSGKKFVSILNGNINTMLNLEIVSDDIKFIVNVSKGKIIKGEIENFEAMSNNGKLNLKIYNLGEEDSLFYVNYFCNDNIISLSSDEISIKNKELYEIEKKIYVINDIEIKNWCNVTLKNSLFEIDDSILIEFNSTERITQIIQGNGTNNNGENVIIENDENTDKCYNSCKIFNFNCYINYFCIKLLIRDICIILFSIIFFLVLMKIIFCFFSKKCIKNINVKSV